MKSFFQSLEGNKVRYLLISGQASVLYGASTFSEDIDLWILPTRKNIGALVSALRENNATVYKLTPPLTLENLKFGHGFHFRLPDEQFEVSYVDVMGKPPRVSSFTKASAQSKVMETDWGFLQVVGIPDLVELKKTRRFADYDVISNLVKIRLLSEKSVRPATLRWALTNSFRVDDVKWILRTWRTRSSLAMPAGRKWVEMVARKGGRASPIALEMLSREIAGLQQQDISYWSKIIRQLRTMRRNHTLLEEGSRL